MNPTRYVPTHDGAAETTIRDPKTGISRVVQYKISEHKVGGVTPRDGDKDNPVTTDMLELTSETPITCDLCKSKSEPAVSAAK